MSENTTPNNELLELEVAGWKFQRDKDGMQEWYLPTGFMKPCCFDDAVKLNAMIKSWNNKSERPTP